MEKSEQPTEQRYGTLRAIAGLMTFIGSAAAIVGAIGAVVGLLADIGSSRLVVMIAGAAALPLGLLMLAAGEGIGVLLDTEANTRSAATAAAVTLTDLRELKDLLGSIDASTRRTATAVEALAATVRR